VSFSERAGPAGELGRQLLGYTGLLFDYWHDYKAGRLDRATFLAWMAPVRAQVEAVLERAVASGIDRLVGSCANILDHRAALWTFIDVEGVEPTNNYMPSASSVPLSSGAAGASVRRASAAICSPSAS